MKYLSIIIQVNHKLLVVGKLLADGKLLVVTKHLVDSNLYSVGKKHLVDTKHLDTNIPKLFK